MKRPEPTPADMAAMRERLAPVTEAERLEHAPAPADPCPEEIEGLDPVVKPWPELSPLALPGFVGDFVGVATRDSEADPAAVLGTFLVRLGAEVGPGPHFMVGETRHHARLFMAICGASGKARKGVSASPVETLFNLPDYSEPARYSPGPLSTGEGLIYAVRDALTETREGDTVVIDPGESDKRLFVLDPEFASALRSVRREGNTLSSIMRCLWDSGDAAPLTKRDRIKCTAAHVCLLTHITEFELLKILSATESFNGFANRFCWVLARRPRLVPDPEPMPGLELFKLRRALAGILKDARQEKRFQRTAQARDLWRAVYPELSKEHGGLAGCIIDRAEAQVVRLSLIYAIADGSPVIDEKHLRAALAFWNYCEASALYLFETEKPDPLADKILEALKDGPKTTTELYRALGNNPPKEQMRAALEKLLTGRKITESVRQGKGRAAKEYALGGLNSFNS